MPNFLTSAACRGKRPSHLASRRHFPRPALVAKLLQERHVARFLVAPDGFGKTDIALQYAETVFSLDRVFWIDGKSPCFLRDLDKGGIVGSLASIEPDPFLAVVEDLPALDPERAESFSRVIDDLLDAGSEVIVTCSPTRDAFSCHTDRVVLHAIDLLLTDEEIDAPRTEGEREGSPASLVPASERAARIAWGGEGRGFLRGVVSEDPPGDVSLPMFCMCALGSGEVADVAALCIVPAEALASMCADYPFLGIDEGEGRFSTASFDVADLACAFQPVLAAMAASSSAEGPDDLVVRIADLLVRRGAVDRACEAVRLLAGKRACAAWADRNGAALLGSGCLVPTLALAAGAGRAARTWGTQALRAATLFLLGDRAGASRSARSVASLSDAPAAVRAACFLIVARCAQARTSREQALDAALGLIPSLEGESEGFLGASATGIGAVAQVMRSLEVSRSSAARCWESSFPEPRGESWAAMLAAACVLDVRGEAACAEARAVASWAGETLDSAVRERSLRPSEVMCALSLEAFERECPDAAGALSDRVRAEAHAVERALLAQRVSHEKARAAELARRRDRSSRSMGSLTAAALAGDGAPSRTAPPLTVNLFGGLEVLIGDDRVDSQLLRRQKVRTLLALLVINRGREFPRDRLVELMWPEADIVPARKNFYGVWSALRRALALPDGTCPYLVRHQNGIRIDAGLLRSDVIELDEVCRCLLFDRPDHNEWPGLFSRVEGRFSDDLMPCDDANAYLAASRSEFRNRLVDSLIAASGRLVACGSAQEGLWFARAALKRDASREDAYAALMRAQVASNQRTSAIETYFECRKRLVEELGIDPSAETMRLYHSVIEEEAVLS